MKNTLTKVVYFDENSVLDYLQIFNKGKMKQFIQVVKNLSGGLGGGANADLEKKDKSLTGIIAQNLAGVSGKGKIDFGAKGGLSGDRIKTTLIENSVLFDFISSINRQRKSKIEILKDYKLDILPDSMAYYASIAPLTEMMEGKSKIDTDISLNVDKMYSAIKALKGYFEVIGTESGRKGQKQIIFRFNLNSFRDNYRLQDVTKMSLIIFAINSGSETKAELNFNSQFNSDEDSIVENDFDGFTGQNYTIDNNVEKEEQQKQQKQLPIYDVYLAGIQ